MKKIFLISATLLCVMVACNNNREKATVSTTEVQQVNTDNNTAKAAAPAAGLPSFAVQDASGNLVNLQSFKGKKVFVNLWATWCPPCRREMPSIEKLSLATDTGKVAFVMLSLDDHFDKAKKFLQTQKLDLPIYYPAEDLPELFNVQGIPTTFIFNEAGVLIRRVDGGDDYNVKAYKTLLK